MNKQVSLYKILQEAIDVQDVEWFQKQVFFIRTKLKCVQGSNESCDVLNSNVDQNNNINDNLLSGINCMILPETPSVLYASNV